MVVTKGPCMQADVAVVIFFNLFAALAYFYSL